MVTGEITPLVSLEVRLLGGFDVRIGDKPMPSLRSRREQWLLALLVLRQDRDTAREWLATTLWPDNDEQQALFYLRKSLSNLRQALGEESQRILAPTPRTVRLELSGVFADVIAFDKAVASAALQEAIRLYRGPLLPDCLEEWATIERNQREQSYLSALEALATQFQAEGDPQSAVHWLRLLNTADPYRESASRALMQALSDCADSAAVNVVYQELRSRLRQELNTAPSSETEALYRQLCQRPGAGLAKPPQLLAAPETRRHLPVPLSDLIGREEEINNVLNVMNRRRLVTLVGTGGIGKTRLAIAVAEASLPRFEQGVWFVDLAALSDAVLVPQMTAKALGIAEESSRPLKETLADALATRSLLLVLDNCEHLPEACADIASFLLSACPALSILATSRQALNVMGEQVYHVPSLPIPPLEPLEPEKDPHFLMEYDAVRLFVDRAIGVNSTFRLTLRNASTVVEICRQLDGIPLAIEMAAARLRSLSVGEIKSRLDDRFRLLTSGNRGALPRQQTLRAAIDWSYDQLTEPERTLLRHLSVFAGGWTREAAERVCGNAEEVSDLLASLVDKSLVIRREEGDETIRYGMLETIRQYAQELMQSEAGNTEFRQRHRDYFLELAEEGRAKLMGPERMPWLETLEAEHANLRQAMAFCREEPDGAEKGLRLGAALWRFWVARGYLREGRDHLASLLAHPGALARTSERADALNAAGILAFFQGDYTAARTLHEEGLSICRDTGDRKALSLALGNLGNVAATQGDYATARAYYEESLEIGRALGDRRNTAAKLNNLGNITLEQGDYAAAHAFYEESLEIERELEYGPGIAECLNNLGIVAQERGDYEVARALFTQSLELHRELGPPAAEASNLAGLGNVAFLQKDYATARTFYEESLAIRQKLGDRWGIGTCLNSLGATAAHQGDVKTASALYKESLKIQQELKNRLGIVGSLESLASLLGQEGDSEKAVRLWGAASALREAIGAAVSPELQKEQESEKANLREAMGEEAFVAAWEEGHTMTMQHTVDYALERKLA